MSQKKHWTRRLKEDFEKLKKERDDYKELYMRAVADFENYKKRMAEDWKKTVEYASERLILELLPVIENLKRALESAEKAKDAEALIKGVRMVYDQLMAVLSKEGLKPFSSKGESFDPRIHEAITTVETDELPPGTVVEELEGGYFFKDKLLRPARVSVAKEPEENKKSDLKGGMQNG
ncbi:MAG: nucleotide exchange factor GrpE [Candidatus Hydrothermae bacterium]|nr:nucleotide exchange factor GrpE [Candidatus Hydrothermae bacterium]